MLDPSVAVTVRTNGAEPYIVNASAGPFSKDDPSIDFADRLEPGQHTLRVGTTSANPKGQPEHQPCEPRFPPDRSDKFGRGRVIPASWHLKPLPGERSVTGRRRSGEPCRDLWGAVAHNAVVVAPRELVVPPRSVRRLAHLLGEPRSTWLQEAADGARWALGRRRLWNVNSTATGGGVAEMLHLRVGYAKDVGVDTRCGRDRG